MLAGVATCDKKGAPTKIDPRSRELRLGANSNGIFASACQLFYGGDIPFKNLKLRALEESIENAKKTFLSLLVASVVFYFLHMNLPNKIPL